MLSQVDFGSGVQPLAQWFKCAAIFLQLNPEGTDFIVPTEVYEEWVQGFDAWYKGVLGVMEGRRLHLVYHREVSIVGNLPFSALDKIARIGIACRRCGIGFSVTAELADVLKQRQQFMEFLASGVLSSVGISHNDTPTMSDDEAAQSCLQEILSSGVQIGLIGPASFYSRIGLLASPALNSRTITLYPRTPSSIAELTVPAQPVAPCFARFRIFVDTDGDFYPCFGLLGVKSARLGSIYENLEDTVLGGRPSTLDLDRYARHGPGLVGAGDSNRVRHSGLPPICEIHRLQLLENETSELSEKKEAVET